MSVRLLCDTSAYSAALRGHAGVADSLRAADEVVISPVVLGELRAGFAKGKHRDRNEAQLETFLASPRVRVLAVDEETSRRYAAIHDALRRAGTPIPIHDVWISASAMQHGLVVLTTDEDFLRVKQILVEHHPVEG